MVCALTFHSIGICFLVTDTIRPLERYVCPKKNGDDLEENWLSLNLFARFLFSLSPSFLFDLMSCNDQDTNNKDAASSAPSDRVSSFASRLRRSSIAFRCPAPRKRMRRSPGYARRAYGSRAPSRGSALRLVGAPQSLQPQINHGGGS